MSETRAVSLDFLANANRDHGGSGQPLCPACKGGRLHPYVVTISLAEIPGMGLGFQGVDSLSGWVAVCVGSEIHNRANREHYEANGWDWDSDVEDLPACGFSMPMTPTARMSA